jgi:uncharacterized protein
MSEDIPEPELDSAVVRGIQKGVAEFNAGKFFECHDTLEEIWQGIRGPARDFFQGLIQISVGFYHLRNGNLRGGESQLEKGLKALRRYGDRYAGMELGNLRGELELWLGRVRAGEDLRANVADLPKYHFTPPAQE